MTLTPVFFTHIPLSVWLTAPLSPSLNVQMSQGSVLVFTSLMPLWFYHALTFWPWTLSNLTCPSADSYFLSQTCSSHPPSRLSHTNSILVLEDKTLVILDSSFSPYPVGKFLQLYFEKSEHFLSSLQLTLGPSYHRLLLFALASLLAFSQDSTQSFPVETDYIAYSPWGHCISRKLLTKVLQALSDMALSYLYYDIFYHFPPSIYFNHTDLLAAPQACRHILILCSEPVISSSPLFLDNSLLYFLPPFHILHALL